MVRSDAPAREGHAQHDVSIQSCVPTCGCFKISCGVGPSRNPQAAHWRYVRPCSHCRAPHFGQGWRLACSTGNRCGTGAERPWVMARSPPRAWHTGRCANAGPLEGWRTIADQPAHRGCVPARSRWASGAVADHRYDRARRVAPRQSDLPADALGRGVGVYSHSPVFPPSEPKHRNKRYLTPDYAFFHPKQFFRCFGLKSCSNPHHYLFVSVFRFGEGGLERVYISRRHPDRR